MWFHAALATAVMTLAVTPACAAKITVSQYGRLVATLPWAVALQKGMFKEAGLDIDGITAGAGGGTSLRNMLGGERGHACGGRAQGAGVVLEPHRRADLGRQARCRNQFDQGPRWQEGRLYQPEVDHRNGDPHGAQAGGPRGQGRHPPARRPGTGLDGAGAGRGRGRALQRSGAYRHPGQIQSVVLRPPILSEIHLAGCGDDEGVRGEEFADLAQDPQGPSSGGRVRLQQPRGDGAHLCPGVGGVARRGQRHLPKYYEWQHWSRGDFSKEGLDAVTDGLISVGELKEPFDWGKLIDQSLLDEDLRRPL